MAQVELSQVTRRFSTEPLAGVVDVSFWVESGTRFTIVGTSGAGKSTVLRLLAGLEEVDSGLIRIGGRDVTACPPVERDIGFVPQQPVVFPHLTVERNLRIGLEMRANRGPSGRVGPDEIRRRLDTATEILGLGELLNRRAVDLSGGEIQRIALGRVFVRQPLVWLLDEPFAHLDPPRKAALRRALLLLREHSPTTMILVTHDPDEAMALGATLAVLDSGRLVQTGDPLAVLRRPASRAVAELIGSPPMNLADGTWIRAASSDPCLCFAAADDAFVLPVPAELATLGVAGRPVTLGIRPEDLVPLPAASPLTDRCLDPVLQGWNVRLVEVRPPLRWLTLQRGRLIWTVPWSYSEIPSTLDLRLPLLRCHWFDGLSRRRLGV